MKTETTYLKHHRPDGTFTQLQGNLPSYAIALNESWTVTGSTNCPGGQRAARWWADGRTEECVSPQPFRAIDIDNEHRVWGHSGPVTYYAMAWHADGTAQTFGVPPGQAYGEVRAASLDGVAVGFSLNAWMLTKDGEWTILPQLPGRSASYCSGLDINRHRQVVGWCNVIFNRHTALLWPSPTQVFDLDTLVVRGASLHSAGGINDDGEIIGVTDDGRGFLLTPVYTSPSLAIRLNQAAFQPGQTLRVTLDLSNPGPILTTDVYVGVILPDGEQVVFLTNLSPLEGQLTTLSSNPRLFARLLQGVSWPANLRATQENYWVYTRSGLEANGTYHLVIAWTKPNSLEDGRIDEGDILALDWKAFQFTGRASNLAAKARD